jgi:hypothetical protein
VLSKRRRNLALFSLCNTLLIGLAGYLMHLHNNDVVILDRIQTLAFNDIVILNRIQTLVF